MSSDQIRTARHSLEWVRGYQAAREQAAERWEAEVGRDLARIGIITAGFFACVLAAFAGLMWWVRS
jgi:Ser/Thr protein kinase RdoA (MazF antagonist)